MISQKRIREIFLFCEDTVLAKKVYLRSQRLRRQDVSVVHDYADTVSA